MEKLNESLGDQEGKAALRCRGYRVLFPITMENWNRADGQVVRETQAHGAQERVSLASRPIKLGHERLRDICEEAGLRAEGVMGTG